MNKGKDIVALAMELTRRAEAKQDFIADTSQLRINPTDISLTLDGLDNAYAVTDLAHRQISSWAGIPGTYYQRMHQLSPELLAENVNHWFHNQENTVRRMIRTLDGDVRAFLSDRYRRVDNEQIAEHALPVLLESPDMEIVSADITDTRLYLKALFPRIQGEVRQGDVVQAGVVVSNSEVGMGSLSVSPLIFRLVCTNGMIADAGNEFGLKKYHVGRRVVGHNQSFDIFRDETLKADDRALMLKLEDTIRAAGNQIVFQSLLNKMRDAASGPQINTPVKSVETLGKSYSLNEGERESVLVNLIRNGDYTRWGAINAVTEIANTHQSYERSTELEIIGGQILDLSASQWEQISKAA